MSIEGLIEVCKVYARGRVQIPSEIRDELGLKDGSKIAWFRDSDGTIYIKKVEKSVRYSKVRR